MPNPTYGTGSSGRGDLSLRLVHVLGRRPMGTALRLIPTGGCELGLTGDGVSAA